VFGAMMGLSAGTQIWIAAGVTDLRRGFTGLSGMVQTVLQENPFSGHVFLFRGRRGDLIKMLWFDGDGLCLFAKRLERGRFIWPQATSGTVLLTPAQPRCCWKGSIGGDRFARRRKWRCERQPFSVAQNILLIFDFLCAFFLRAKRFLAYCAQ
jgi:transposase